MGYFRAEDKKTPTIELKSFVSKKKFHVIYLTYDNYRLEGTKTEKDHNNGCPFVATAQSASIDQKRNKSPIVQEVVGEQYSIVQFGTFGRRKTFAVAIFGPGETWDKKNNRKRFGKSDLLFMN